MTFVRRFLLIMLVLLILLSNLPAIAAEEVVVVLDPGHGGKDNGSFGVLNGTTYTEKQLNDIVTAHLYDSLGNYEGIKVYLTRYDDSKPSLQTRSTIAGDLKADLMISLHMNSLENAAYWGGTEILVHSGNYLPQAAKDATSIANDILNRFTKHGLKNRGVKTRTIDGDDADFYLYPNGAYGDYYGIIRYATSMNVPAMIIEHGFMSNASDLAFLSKSENLKKLADETAAAVASHFGLAKGNGNKVTMKIQEDLTLGDIPTTLTVGDEIPSLTASGGSGSGQLRFESNDCEVIKIEGNKLIAVGPGNANITAVRGTDGEYQAKTSDNYIRIAVKEPYVPTPTPTATPTQAPTPTPISTPTQTQTTASVPTQISTIVPTQTPSETNTQMPASSSITSSPQATNKVSDGDSSADDFWTVILIIAGVFAAFIAISVVLLVKSNNKNRRKYYN